MPEDKNVKAVKSSDIRKPSNPGNLSTSNKPKTIDEYIAAQPEGVRPYLNEVRGAISEAIPEAEERISWSMPAYWKGHNIIHFAGAKKHIGIYPGPDAIIYFSHELEPYHTSKGAIQIPYSKDLPLALIAEIARWCFEQEMGAK